MPLLDECMVGVTAGEVSPLYAGMAYCTVIMGCSERLRSPAGQQWTAALTRWCDTQPGLVPFRGNCLIHRCELMRLEVAWAEALDAANQACGYLSGPVSWDTLGSAYYQLAEVQRLRGDFDDAEQNYRGATSPATGQNRGSRCCGSPRVALTLLRPSCDGRWRRPPSHRCG